MSNINRVGSNTQGGFGSYRVARVQVPLTATGSAVAVLPILSGGTAGNDQYVIRRITVGNPYNTAGGAVPNIALANVSVGQTNDGANLVTSNTVISNVTGAATYQDLTLAAGAATTAYTANALFVNVNTSVANAGVWLSVYGDVQTF